MDTFFKKDYDVFMFSRRVVYQFANLKPFKRLDLEQDFNMSKKTILDDSSLSDGTSDIRGINRSLKSDYIYNISFVLDSQDDFDVYRKVFCSGKQILYLISEEYLNTVNIKKGVKFLWNYAECVSYSDNFKTQQEKGENSLIVNASFRLVTPFLYENNDNDIFFTDYFNSQAIRYNGDYTYSGNFRYNQTQNAVYGYLTNLTDSQKLNSFGLQNCEPKYKLNLIDRFFDVKINSKPENSKLNFNNAIFNLLRCTEDFGNAVWNKNDVTISQNSAISLTQNQDTTVFTVGNTPVNAFVSQNNIHGLIGTLCFGFDIKQGTVGNATHIVIEQYNPTDGTATSGLLAITSGQNLGDGWYRHIYKRITNTQNDLTSVAIKFKNSSDNQANTGSTILVKNPRLYLEELTGVNPNYTVNPQLEYEKYGFWQNSFTYTLTNNNQVTVYTNPLDLSSTFENNILIVRCGQLAQGQSLSVLNTSNNTGFKLEWLGNQSSKSALLILTHKNQVFDTGIDDYLDINKGQFRLLPLGFGMLKMRNLKPVDEFFDNQNFDVLQIQKNTSQNMTLVIKNLKTFN